jgi:hypothetical protein
MTRQATALEGLARLEAPAIWHPGEGAPPRDVYLSIGEATLLIQAPDGTPLTHWSLPALEREGRAMPARYRPGAAAEEAVEIAEPDMVEALDRVRAAVERGRPRAGRLRLGLVALALAGAVAAGALWLPGEIRARTAAALPPPLRADLGEALMVRLSAVTGPPCAAPLGLEALDRLRAAALPAWPGAVVVLRDMPAPALALPGGTLVLSEAALGRAEGPREAAGLLIAAAEAAREGAPLARLVSDLPLVAVIGLATSARVEPALLDAHARRLLAAPPPLAPAAPPGGPPTLDAAAWTSLRAICT